MIKKIAVNLAHQAGKYLLSQRNAFGSIEVKGDQSNILTAADLSSERLIIEGIKREFPSHSIISEENGCDLFPDSVYTWIIDPLDGTSNFAAGIPWYGVLIAVLENGRPIVGVMYLPESDVTYVAERGMGVTKNNRPVKVTTEQKLHNVLWAYGMDASLDRHSMNLDSRLLVEVLRHVRNVRSTNSLIDPAFTSDGRFGGMLNRNTRLWDIAAPSLIIEEAGGVYTDIQGEKIVFDISESAATRQYAVVAGSPALHKEMLDILWRVLGHSLREIPVKVDFFRKLPP